MPVQDFLITFRADTRSALSEINALAARVVEVDAALNRAMGRLESNRGTNNPIAQLASGAGGATRSINQINQAFLQMGRGIKLTTEETQALMAAIANIQRSFSRDTRGGFGASINTGKLQEAIRYMTILKDAGRITSEQYVKMSNDMTEAFGKVARIPEALRDMPIADQKRVSDLMRQQGRELAQLEALRQPVGGERNLRSHQTALENYIRTVRQLGQYGLSTAADLDKLEQELRQVRAASSLQGQRTTNERDIQSLRRTADSIRLQTQTGQFAGRPAQELTQMRALQRALVELEARGDPVQQELAQTAQRIRELETAAALASQRTRELARSQGLTDRVDAHRLRAQRPFTDAAGELRNLKGLERGLAQLEARGDPVQRELDETRRKIEQLEQAANRAKSINQLLSDRARLETRLSRARLDGGNTRNIIRDLKGVEEALDFRGAGDASKLNNIRAQFAALPAVIAPATKSMLDFNQTAMAQVRFNEAMRLPVPPAIMTRGLQNGIELMKQGYAEGAEAVDFFAQRVSDLPPTLGRAAQGMLNHGRRVAEGLFIYELFGRALQGIGDQIKLVNDLAREEIRFSAVAGGLGAGGSDEFLLNLQDIAVRTNTPMAELAGQIDSVASAMLDAGDATKIAADSTNFLNTVGQFTNITQRGLAQETENLLGIYNQTGDSADEFADRIGRITVAGRNNSTLIAGITDVISKAGVAANAAGFDFDFLAAASARMVQDLRGSLSGDEIGNIFNTVIGKLSDPDAVRNIEEISGGLIRMRDSAGELRPAHETLIDIFAAIRDGALTIEQGELVLDQIVPPLSPSTRNLIVETFGRNLPLAIGDMGRVMSGTAEDAKNLSDALVEGPGERFARSMIEIQGALTGIFSDEIIEAGNTFADILKSIAGILGSGEAGGGVGGAIASWTIRLALFGTGLTVVRYAWKQFYEIVFGSAARLRTIAAQVGTSTAQLAAAASGAGAASGVAAGQLTLFGPAGATAAGGMRIAAGAMGVLKGAIAGVIGVAKSLIPLLIIMSAFEMPDLIADSGAAGDLREAALERTRLRREDLSAALVNVNSGPVSGILEEIAKSGFGGDGSLSRNQIANILELAKALTELERQGKLTANNQKLLEDQILSTNGSVSETIVSSDDMIANMQAQALQTDEVAGSTEWYKAQLGDLDETLDDVTDAERRATEAMMVNAELTDERAAAIARLTQQLREGTITVDEWAEGQSNASDASEAAANFIAHYGDQLSLIPGLQERIAQTGESAAAALMGMLLDNPDTIDQRIGVIDQMVAIAEANAEAAEEVENNPIEFSVETQELLEDAETTRVVFEWLTTGTYQTKRIVDENKIEPQIALEKLRAQAAAALKIYQIMLQASSAYHQATSSAMQAANPEVGQAYRSRVANQSGDIAALERAIAELEAAAGSLGDAGDELSGLGDAFDTLGGISGDDPRLSSGGSQPAQTGIIDIGDLPASAISQIVAIATQAQRQVVAAGGVVDTDETAAIFKDAAFQQLISGIDQRFLQQAIEELTEVERKRLELEQQRLQDVTRSMLVQTGPIQSIVSAPVLSAGGGVLSGQGLNADPRLGNFTINVPINWSGMSLTQLQTFIYDSIAKAWIDAGRGG